MIEVGEIRVFAFNFPPLGWVPCDGRLLSISENEALFQLIGTTYGGDGQQTFAVPDLRGRAPVHVGAHPEWTVNLGEVGGTPEVTLTAQNITPHTHAIMGTDGPRTQASPDNAVLVPGDHFASSSSPTGALGPQTIAPTTPAQPHTNVQPFLALHYCISLVGVFPSIG